MIEYTGTAKEEMKENSSPTTRKYRDVTLLYFSCDIDHRLVVIIIATLCALSSARRFKIKMCICT